MRGQDAADRIRGRVGAAIAPYRVLAAVWMLPGWA